MGGAQEVQELRYYQIVLGAKGGKGLQHWYVIV